MVDWLENALLQQATNQKAAKEHRFIFTLSNKPNLWIIFTQAKQTTEINRILLVCRRWDCSQAHTGQVRSGGGNMKWEGVFHSCYSECVGTLCIKNNLQLRLKKGIYFILSCHEVTCWTSGILTCQWHRMKSEDQSQFSQDHTSTKFHVSLWMDCVLYN